MLLEYLSTKGITVTGTDRANRLEKCPLENQSDSGKSWSRNFICLARCINWRHSCGMAGITESSVWF